MSMRPGLLEFCSALLCSALACLDNVLIIVQGLTKVISQIRFLYSIVLRARSLWPIFLSPGPNETFRWVLPLIGLKNFYFRPLGSQ